MTKDHATPPMLVIGVVLAVALAAVAALIAGGRLTSAQAAAPGLSGPPAEHHAAASPAERATVSPRGDIAAARRCASIVVQGAPKIVVSGVVSTGASCAKAAALLKAQLRSYEPRGKKISRSSLMDCRLLKTDGPIHCEKGQIKIRFWPDCSDHQCNA